MDAGYDGNDNVVWVTVEDIDGEEDTTATVAAVIETTAGEEVEASFPLAYIAARSRYEGQPDEDEWTVGQKLRAVISVTGTGGEEGQITVDFRVQRRTA